MATGAGVERERWRGPVGLPWSEAGAPYAVLWVVVIAARIAFVYASYHSRSLDRWYATHHISPNEVTVALPFMAAAMVLARTASLYVRATRLPLAQSGQGDATDRLAA